LNRAPVSDQAEPYRRLWSDRRDGFFLVAENFAERREAQCRAPLF
jgi:hypothetical protein